MGIVIVEAEPFGDLAEPDHPPPAGVACRHRPHDADADPCTKHCVAVLDECARDSEPFGGGGIESLQLQQRDDLVFGDALQPLCGIEVFKFSKLSMEAAVSVVREPAMIRLTSSKMWVLVTL